MFANDLKRHRSLMKCLLDAGNVCEMETLMTIDYSSVPFFLDLQLPGC